MDAGWVPDYPKPEDEKDAVRGVILAVRPDVIVFQEMGPGGYLEELAADLAASGLDYPYRECLVAADSERCLAALSRIPFKEVRRNNTITCKVYGEVLPVKRGLLGLTFETNGRDWTVYNIHLKSRTGSDTDAERNEKERHAEASAIRGQILKEQGADACWLLLGDTNDAPHSGTWNRLTHKGEKLLGVDIRPTDSRGEHWTYYYSRTDTYERIDIMMASPPTLKVLKTGSARLYDGPEAGKASDHRLIYADLEFR
jgi:endonuclease/exonuclease/phosphatase family metal-dependent hydrolase